jgi:hypothetical protein
MNTLGLENNHGSLSRLWKPPLTRQQWSKSSLQAAERAGGKPLLPSLPHWGMWNDAFSLWMSALGQQTKPTVKDAAKNSKEPAVEASFSFAPPPQAENASKPLFWSSLSSQHWGKTRQRLGASKPLLTCFFLSQVKALPATSQPSCFAKLRTRESLSKQLPNASKALQASAKRVRALEQGSLIRFLPPQVETIPTRASQVASPSWGCVRASPSCLSQVEHWCKTRQSL